MGIVECKGSSYYEDELEDDELTYDEIFSLELIEEEYDERG